MKNENIIKRAPLFLYVGLIVGLPWLASLVLEPILFAQHVGLLIFSLIVSSMFVTMAFLLILNFVNWRIVVNENVVVVRNIFRIEKRYSIDELSISVDKYYKGKPLRFKLCYRKKTITNVFASDRNVCIINEFRFIKK